MKPEVAIIEIGQAERHFNDIEARYRLLASTWILAAFAAMGFVCKTTGLPFSRELLLIAIGIAASAGVQLLWVIDIFVYHRLLDANFAEGCRLEATHPELPQVRWAMFNSVGKRSGVVWLIRFYYFGCSVVPLLFGVSSLLLKLLARKLSYTHSLALIPLTLCLASTLFLFAKSNNEWLEQTLKELKLKHNQRMDPTVKTPVELGDEQGTAGHT